MIVKIVKTDSSESAPEADSLAIHQESGVTLELFEQDEQIIMHVVSGEAHVRMVDNVLEVIV